MQQLVLIGRKITTTSSSLTEDFQIMKAFNVRINPPKAYNIIEVTWHAPPLDSLKCNCDVSYNLNLAGCDGIFRINQGNFLLAFADHVCGCHLTWQSLLLFSR